MCFVCATDFRGWTSLSLYKKDGSSFTPTRRQFVATGAAAGAALMAGPSLSSAADEKITIFRNGRIYTVEDSQPWVQAVVVRGRHIVYVGDDAGAMKFAAPGVELFDLKNRMMMPGFVEAHWHLATTTFARGAWVNYDKIEDVYASVREYAKAHPNEKVITGFG